MTNDKRWNWVATLQYGNLLLLLLRLKHLLLLL